MIGAIRPSSSRALRDIRSGSLPNDREQGWFGANAKVSLATRTSRAGCADRAYADLAYFQNRLLHADSPLGNDRQ